MGEDEHAQRDADPQEGVREHRRLETDQARVPLNRCPFPREESGHEEMGGLEQLSQRPQVENIRRRPRPEAHDKEQDSSEVTGDGTSGQCRQRELDRGCRAGGRQRNDEVGADECRRLERTKNLGFDARHEQGQQDARRHHEQDQRIEHECREKSRAEVVRLADGSGVEEGMHPCLRVTRGRIARHRCRYQQPEHIADPRDECDDIWRIDQGPAVARVVEEPPRNQLVRNDKEDREIEPGPDAPRLVHELEAKNLPELHPAPRRRVIAQKYTSFRSGVTGSKSGPGRASP